MKMLSGRQNYTGLPGTLPVYYGDPDLELFALNGPVFRYLVYFHAYRIGTKINFHGATPVQDYEMNK